MDDAPFELAGRGSKVVTAEDAGDAGFRDIDAELSKFPDDAEVAPAGVLTSEPQDQLDGLVRERGSPDSMGIGPVSPDKGPVPPEDRLGCDEERRHLSRGASLANEAMSAQSDQEKRGRAI